jgi:hypothetical protein
MDKTILQQLQGWNSDAIRVRTRAEELAKRKTALETNVGQAKHRLSLRPKVQAFMETLQHTSHARGIGMFENLLTMFNREILPQVKKPVVMDLGVERGVPALNIQLGKGENGEDLWDGAGGSITNVISLGLRYIALTRSPLRKFLILDEPDCWLEVSAIPQFGMMVARMSKDMHVQTIWITHHAVNALGMKMHRVHLLPDAVRGVRVEYPNGLHVWKDEEKGIRRVTLEGVMSHAHSVIELAPGAIILSGPNHTGKSVLGAVLRAMTQGTATDKMIRDGYPELKVRVEIEDGMVLEWIRHRKGSPKEVFTLFDKNGVELHKSRGERGRVPGFVLDALNVRPIQDLDIQLHHQKLPVFLLDKPSSVQAQILSAGMESEHLHSMMDKYKSMVQSDTKEAELGERELAQINARWEKLEAIFPGQSPVLELANLEASIHALRQQAESLMVENETLHSMEQHAMEWQQLSHRVEIWNGANVGELPTPPEVENVVGIQKDIANWELWQNRLAILESGEKSLPEVPDVEDTSILVQAGREWTSLIRRIRQLEAFAIELPSTPDLQDSESLRKDVESWEQILTAMNIAAKKREAAMNEEDQCKENIARLLANTGNRCPTCHQTMTVEHLLEGSH